MAKRQCAYCTYLDLHDKKDGQCKCEKDETYRFADSEDAENCRKYCERWRMDMAKGDEAIKEAKKYRENNSSYTSVGCFITTAVVEILNMKDNCPMMETLRFLRGYHMQNNPKYRTLLMKYDTLGPAIAAALKHDENAESVALDIIPYLIKAQKLTALDEIDAAIKLYEDMTDALIKRYISSYFIPEKAANLYDQENGGHGSFKLKRS